MARKRRQFSEEFKQEALRRCEREAMTEVARSLDIGATLLHKWKKSAEDEGTEAFRGNGVRTEADQELFRLRSRVKELEEEKDILKKAAAYFAKHQR